MNDEITTDAILSIEDGKPNYSWTKTREAEVQSSGLSQPKHKIVIAATFTADPLRQPLEFWMARIGIPVGISFAPYSQVMQQLLDPGSLISTNKSGLNILLIRLEDWLGIASESGAEASREQIDRATRDFIVAIEQSRAVTTAPMLVFFCPCRASLPSNSGRVVADKQKYLVKAISKIPGVFRVEHAEIDRLYPVSSYEDAYADRIANIPYSKEYFGAVATMAARRLTVMLKSKFKVIAIDCDNTLWKGVCGEDGIAGIEVTASHRELQRMLVKQHDAGMLLCLCSKNNPNDVEEVFLNHPQMVLREDHLVCSRVNWESKSINLLSISQELGLSLESFIMIDDSQVECEEIKSQYPTVLTLPVPAEGNELLHFISHTWAFDRIGVTDEASGRNLQYKQNRARGEARDSAKSLAEFLRSLDIKVNVKEARSDQLPRVAELVQRTSQFNLTSIKRSMAELDELLKEGLRCFAVDVKDRFGDYGLVGAVIIAPTDDSLDVDTFVLSCRALGRGVEHRIMNALGEIAMGSGKSYVKLKYRRTERSVPAWNFLEAKFRMYRSSELSEARYLEYRVPVEYAVGAALEIDREQPVDVPSDEVHQEIERSQSETLDWHQIAYQLSKTPDVATEGGGRPGVHHLDRAQNYVEPRSPEEIAIAGIWAEVLGAESVGVRDDFINLGGDSLLAVQVIGRIATDFSVELSVYDFFESPTVEGLSKRLSSSKGSRTLVERIGRDQRFSLSLAQQRLWFIDQLEGGGNAYNVPITLRLSGVLDVDVLRRALDGIVERHESLRTTFYRGSDGVVQTINGDSRFQLITCELLGMSNDERDMAIRLQARQEIRVRFDLGKAPLIKARLLVLSEADAVLLITMHHMITDGWSIAILIRELGLLYDAFRSGKSERLPALPIQYVDYVQWQRNEWEKEGQERKIAYWREHIQGAPDLLILPTDRPRPAVQSYCGESLPIGLGRDLSLAIEEFTRRNGITLATALYAAWAVTLSGLSGQKDIVIGMPVANRLRPEFDKIVGLFVNTLAIRIKLDDEPTVQEVLDRAKEVMKGAAVHQDVPFEKVVEAVQPVRSLSHSPIFQVMFVVLPTPRQELDLEELRITELESPLHSTKFDLTLSLQESDKGIVGGVNFSSDLFDGKTIERWIEYYKAVLESFINDQQRRVTDISMLRIHERHELIEMFRGRSGRYDTECTIGERFEEQVRKTPSNIAIEYNGEQVSYAELNSRADQLAAYLRARNVGRDDLVAICMERSVDMVVAVMGVLKAGGAYLPLDSENPRDRLGFILEDANPRVLLIREHLRNRLSGICQEMVALDSDWQKIERNYDGMPEADWKPRADNLAYVIYTSGSTGRPKGVMVQHRSIVNYVCHVIDHFDVAAGDGSLVCTSFGFDLMLTGFYPVLLSGRTVRLCKEVHGLPSLRDDLMTARNIAPLKLTPSHLALLEQPLREGLLRDRIRTLVIGGEQLQEDALRLWKECSPGTRLFNHYGPTETTVGCIAGEIERCDSGVVPIGRPISNVYAYILNERLQLVPIGVTGEIYIGGSGVSRGYRNRPGLTAERFVADPHSGLATSRMYRTGDLGRVRRDGQIEYVGRIDHQVKIRGHRIELGEIESQLMRHEQVAKAMVIPLEDLPGDKRLIGYIAVSAQDHQPSLAAELREYLKKQLPDYMVPSAFVLLDQFPVTPNGKVDLKRLPRADNQSRTSKEYEQPLGSVEQALAEIWQSLLKVDRVGRLDNFFELGGHSLLVMHLLDRLRTIGFSASVRHVFQSQKLSDLANVLIARSDESAELPPNRIPEDCQAITPGMLPLLTLLPEHIEKIVSRIPGGAANIKDIYPLTPLQEGILFHHLLGQSEGDVYVVPTLLKVASRERMNDLIAALTSVVERHDVLRTAILWDHLPRPVQVVCRRVVLPVVEVHLNSEQQSYPTIIGWMRPERQRIDLDRAPLLRLTVAEDDEGQCYVLMQIHHIIEDARSVEIMLNELVAYLEGRESELSPSVAYRGHVAQAIAYAQEQRSEVFFRNKLGDVTESTAPFGLFDVHGDGVRIQQASASMNSELSQRVRTQAKLAGVSAATLFHAAGGLVVAKTCGKGDIVFGAVLLGRLHGAAGAQGGLGMFINTLPLRLCIDGRSVKELVQITQQELVELMSHEQESLAVAQRCSAIGGGVPLFTVLLNYRHGARKADSEWIRAEGIELLARHAYTNYPITLSVDDVGDGFTLTAQTARPIDPQRMVSYLETALHSLIVALEQRPDEEALALCVVPDNERRLTTDRFNDTSFLYPKDKLIHELFEEEAKRSADVTAVIHGEASLTYRELNVKADYLARLLQGKGVGPDDLVGICVERSLGMVVGLLGVLKAGAAYVPLDPTYPADRLAYMLDDARPKIVLSQGNMGSHLTSVPAEIIELEPILAAATDACLDDGDRLPLPRQGGAPASSLLYVIYTSGSTGRPKGTAMAHRSMVNLIDWHRRELAARSRTVLQFAALSFDVAFQEVYSTLCTGGTLVLLDEHVRKDPGALMELLASARIETLFAPPIMLQSLAEYFTVSRVVPTSLENVITAGEQLRVSSEIVEFLKSRPACKLHNHYGPTETHVVTALTLDGSPEDWAPFPTIGRPIANTSIYILDERLMTVPMGAIGEIHIGGANVARGYLNRPSLTAGRFIPDPFSGEPGSTMYRSGDLGRWRADGSIEYLGRNDSQVKIRGFRVEVGEVEALLASHWTVKEALVLMREDDPGQKRLVAYLTMRGDAGLDPEEIRSRLKKVLPDYMIPTAFVVLQRLPLTLSGKIDKKALPAPEENAYTAHEYASPMEGMEARLAGIWANVLQLKRVGRNDNFFEIGGHSLLVLKLILKINENISCSLKVADMYRCPTVRELAAAVVGDSAKDDVVNISQESTLDVKISDGMTRVAEHDKGVMLTGATGFVGRFLLTELLRDPDVTAYCLVRANSDFEARARLDEVLRRWDLWRDDYNNRIVAVAGDLKKPRLGLDERVYDALANQVDSIYHCGTSMNHLETYEMAKRANVESAKEIVQLASIVRCKIINYVSTLGIFGGSAFDENRMIDETSAIDDEIHFSSRGYIASKWVADKIFAKANDCGIPCNIFRLGLVWADARAGRFDELQNVYRVIKSAIMSGYGIRDHRYPLAPTPVDYVTRSIVELAKRHRSGRGVFHISASRQKVGGLFERCNEIASTNLKLIPYYKWIQEIKRRHDEGDSLPIAPLIGYAFHMDERSFDDYRLRVRSVANLEFDFSRTHQELEAAGIITPEFDDELLKLCLMDMFVRDKGLQEYLSSSRSPPSPERIEFGTSFGVGR